MNHFNKPSAMTQTRTLQRLFSAILALVVLCAAPGVHAADGGQKKKLVIDTTAAGVEVKEELAQVPVLVRLHSGNFTFAEAKPDGSDLHFFAADGKTPLPSQVENFEATDELANVWLLLPKVAAAGKTPLVMTWGGDKAGAAPAGGKVQDPAAVFTFHFAASDVLKDSTANAIPATSGTAKSVAAGPIGGAVALDGGDGIALASSPSLKLAASAGFTFSAWVKPTDVSAAAAGLLALPASGNGLRIGLVAGKLEVAMGTASVISSLPLKPAVWQHVAVVANAGKVTLYVDGIETGAGNLALSDVAGDALIGRGFGGELDEVALVAASRPAAYVTLQALGQAADSPLISADEEGGDSGEVSYFAILIGSVTLDGWIVIGLLTVMAVVSVYVMVSKAVMLRTVGRANDAFLAAFKVKPRALLTPGHADIASLMQDPSSQRSSVYRLYAIGLDEVMQRFTPLDEAGQPRRLSSAGLQAIRTSLDAAMMRENQRFNSGIVLLTIAISGGPFLGLLGTVVGVMITFAAIAAAGEVNVNSIAPGIAAALVATVAGLAVAIPALFGYNWLASQIKNLSGNTAVFVDEFVAKLAEMYAD
jgi:biopolymer transport protein ExbB